MWNNFNVLKIHVGAKLADTKYQNIKHPKLFCFGQ